MKIQVEMLAFKEKGIFREVEIPDAEDKLENVLEEVFCRGQNDFQAQQLPSVSVGDIIHYQDKKYVVCAISFKEITQEQYDNYLKMNHRDRHFSALLDMQYD